MDEVWVVGCDVKGIVDFLEMVDDFVVGVFDDVDDVVGLFGVVIVVMVLEVGVDFDFDMVVVEGDVGVVGGDLDVVNVFVGVFGVGEKNCGVVGVKLDVIVEGVVGVVVFGEGEMVVVYVLKLVFVEEDVDFVGEDFVFFFLKVEEFDEIGFVGGVIVGVLELGENGFVKFY